MKRFLILLLLIIIFGCKKNPETFIEHINGYWEIESVMLPDGTEKNYTFNETIDFFSINDSLTGFRKKLKPNLQGKYTASMDAEKLKLVIEQNSLNAYYTTPYSNWKETILYAGKDQMKVINEDNKVYLYKRFEPLKIE